MSKRTPSPSQPSRPGPGSIVSLRSATKYQSKPSIDSFTAPLLQWLQGSWYVTHSTLPMWRKSKNVRITYKIIEPTVHGRPFLLDDEVTSEPIHRSWVPHFKSIRGIDTPDGEGTWNWKGKGWLKITNSHWEILGWGERDGEKWVVTWFAPSMFTPAGVDVYSSEKSGINEELYQDILQALQALEAKEIVDLVKEELRKVQIEY
jgi:hypothetical protein